MLLYDFEHLSKPVLKGFAFGNEFLQSLMGRCNGDAVALPRVSHLIHVPLWHYRLLTVLASLTMR